MPARNLLEGRARPHIRHRPVDDAPVGVDETTKVGHVLPGEGPQVLVLQTLDRAQIVARHRKLLFSVMRATRGPMPRGIGPSGQRAGTGLGKHVLAQRLVPCDGKVTVLLPAVAAAA